MATTDVSLPKENGNGHIDSMSQSMDITVINSVINTTLVRVDYKNLGGDWTSVPPSEIPHAADGYTFGLNIDLGIWQTEGWVEYQVTYPNGTKGKTFKLWFKSPETGGIQMTVNGGRNTSETGWIITPGRPRRPSDSDGTFQYVGENGSSTITVINRADRMTLYLNKFTANWGTWDTIPVDSIPPRTSVTFKIKPKGKSQRTEGTVVYRFPGSNSTTTLSFCCTSDAGESNWMRSNHIDWKQTFETSGPLDGIFEFVGEVTTDIGMLLNVDDTLPVINTKADLEATARDRSSTITVYNKVPGVTLLLDGSDNVQGVWGKAPSNFIPSDKSDEFNLDNRLGFCGSEGWVRYKILSGGVVSDDTVTLSFACPIYGKNSMVAGPGKDWKVVKFDSSSPLRGIFEFSKEA